ncbi:MAG: SDR family oxidoreductase [Ruminococcaceae bacterium]|nr:SDR family oxidoreductase [Oscillospiraceae bacterium]
MAKGYTLIVGADSDIGCGLMREIDEKIIAHYYGFEDKIKALKSEGKEIVDVWGDLSDVEGIKRFIEKIGELPYDIDKIVHLPSSQAAAKRMSKFDGEAFLRDVNIQATSAGMIFANLLPKMAKRKFGRVAAVLTSYCIGVPPKFIANYVASKYALLGLLKSAAVEFAGKGITVNAVAPSMTETKFLDNLPQFEIEANAKANPMGRNAAIEDVVFSLKWLISDECEFMTGAVIPVTGGSNFY